MPSNAMFRSISSDHSPAARQTAASPQMAANRKGRPTKAKCTPSARALRTSLPRRIPPSNITVIGAAARAISGSTRGGAMAPSSCRPPWFDTIMPSAPASRALWASSAARMPLITKFPRQRLRMDFRCSQVSRSRGPVTCRKPRDGIGGPLSASLFSKRGKPWLTTVLSTVPMANAGDPRAWPAQLHHVHRSTDRMGGEPRWQDHWNARWRQVVAYPGTRGSGPLVERHLHRCRARLGRW
jgi:hypothetical protein